MSKPVFQTNGQLSLPETIAAAKKAMIVNWVKWENAKEEYANLREAYIQDLQTWREQGVALDKPGTDARVQKAAKDGAYFRNEAMAYASILAALKS